jgi:hypothetical protein
MQHRLLRMQRATVATVPAYAWGLVGDAPRTTLIQKGGGIAGEDVLQARSDASDARPCHAEIDDVALPVVMAAALPG